MVLADSVTGVFVIITGTSKRSPLRRCAMRTIDMGRTIYSTAHAIEIYARGADGPNNAQTLINEIANFH
jgi:hypothetical protein